MLLKSGAAKTVLTSLRMRVKGQGFRVYLEGHGDLVVS